MGIVEKIRRLKVSFSLYNFFKQKQLRHNSEAYKKFKINKYLFQSISSKDFEQLEKGERPWLDLEFNKDTFESKLNSSSFEVETKNTLAEWPKNGYAILHSFFDSKKCEEINTEIERLIQEQAVEFNSSEKIMFANKKSDLINAVTQNKKLKNVLEFILGEEVVPFQTINFIKGSEQEAHSDSIHMTTFPLGYLLAVWIALEDISLEQGALSYYPGSHKLGYIMNKDYNRGGNRFTLGSENNYLNYEKKIAETIQENKLKKNIFEAKKGDILIWHANLIHGGEPIVKKDSTRKSMVIHYFGKNVVKYHEITERPALL